ncbi:MAG: radical SAM protein [Chloracidobacterium sp.]|nr:radical SAM protein [Chloracidobacterium sp.]
MKMIPINSYILKIASRCNLNCSYCYEYNMGDDSWLDMPAFMEPEIVKLVATRIHDHCTTHELTEIYINLHGGEPLLLGKQRTRNLLETFVKNLEGIKIYWGIQTNGVLLDPEWIDLLHTYGFFLGLSIDGPAATNDRFRVDHAGKGTHLRVMTGAGHLASEKGELIFAGCLSVIDPESDPLEVFRHLLTLNAKAIDFLLPHGNWDDVPNSKRPDPMSVTPFADWLIPIFDEWYDQYSERLEIRMFEEIIEHLAGGPGRLETVGLQPVSLIVVASNGDIEGVDTLKSIPGQQLLGLNLKQHSFDDAVKHPKYQLRQNGLEALSGTCQSCSLVKTCGGGYLPHRWSKDNQFQNPSIFCSDLTTLILHIRRRVTSTIDATSVTLSKGGSQESINPTE